MAAGAGVVRDALAQLAAKVADIAGFLFGGTTALEGFGSAWRVLGGVLCFVVGTAVTLVGVLVAAVTAALSVVDAAIHAVAGVFNGVADAINGVILILGGLASGSWTDLWTGMKLVAFGVVDAIIGAVLALAGAIGGVVDAMAGLFGGEAYRQKGVWLSRASLRADMAEGMGVEDLTVARPVRTGGATPPAVASGEALSSMPAVAAMAPAVPSSFAPPQVSQAPSAPVVVQLQVDGQTLATAVHRADRDSASRAFSPVPVY